MGIKIQRAYLGFLSFFIVETLAGSNVLWIINPFYWFVTFPLYLFHLFFFVNVAIRTGKTSFQHIYLWGMLFGLYESWITKVIWSGYGDDGFAFSSVYGFGIHETLVLVLFWHPILAFILPLVIGLQIMAPDSGEVLETIKFNDLEWILSREKLPTRIRRFTFLAGLAILGFNTGNPIISLATSIPGILIVYLGYRYWFRDCDWNDEKRYNVLFLRKKGIIITTSFLLFLYITGFFVLRFDRIPDPPQIIITVLIYLLILLIIWRIPVNSLQYNMNEESILTYHDLFIKIIQISMIAAVVSIIPWLFILVVIIAICEIPFSLSIAYHILIKSRS